MFLDFYGPTIPIINPDTGEVRQAQAFVATLDTYIEACENQRQESWLMAHVRAFEFFGSIPQLLVASRRKRNTCPMPIVSNAGAGQAAVMG
ncbi:hypothetical protein BA187_17610 [Serratia marcescens]|nr:hypothetical protein BA187_17610 [Serratia marcescens]